MEGRQRLYSYVNRMCNHTLICAYIHAYIHTYKPAHIRLGAYAQGLFAVAVSGSEAASRSFEIALAEYISMGRYCIHVCAVWELVSYETYWAVLWALRLLNAHAWPFVLFKIFVSAAVLQEDLPSIAGLAFGMHAQMYTSIRTRIRRACKEMVSPQHVCIPETSTYIQSESHTCIGPIFLSIKPMVAGIRDALQNTRSGMSRDYSSVNSALKKGKSGGQTRRVAKTGTAQGGLFSSESWGSWPDVEKMKRSTGVGTSREGFDWRRADRYDWRKVLFSCVCMCVCVCVCPCATESVFEEQVYGILLKKTSLHKEVCFSFLWRISIWTRE
jgi:hypothetical protein